MNDQCLTPSSSFSSLETNNSSWSFMTESDSESDDADQAAELPEAKKNYEKQSDCEMEIKSYLKFDTSNFQHENNVWALGNEVGVEVESEFNLDDDDNDNENDANTDSDDEYDDNDDELFLISEDDVLNDSDARKYIDVARISRKLDDLSRCFDSPFSRILDDFGLERNIGFMAIFSLVAIVVVVFYFNYTTKKLELSPMDDLCFADNVSFLIVNDQLIDLQYRYELPSVPTSSPLIEVILKPTIFSWSSPSSETKSLPANAPITYTYNPGNMNSISRKQEHFSHEIITMNESVQRYLKYTEKMKKMENKINALISINTNKTTDDAQAEMYKETEKQSSAISIPTLPIPPFSETFFEAEKERKSLTSLSYSSSPSVSLKKNGVQPVVGNDLCVEPIEEPCLPKKMFSNSVKLKTAKPKYNNNSDQFLEEKKFQKQKQEKYAINQSKAYIGRTAHQLEKNMCKSEETVSKTIEETKILLIERSKKSVNHVTMKESSKANKMYWKNEKKRCILNSTCGVLTSLARTLASISLFPAIIGQSNAVKYIDSLLDFSTCNGFRLVCEACWWTKECCPRKKCDFRPWQLRFNTKRFLISQHQEMSAVFKLLDNGSRLRPDPPHPSHSDHSKYRPIYGKSMDKRK
ncbi:unnamed protein product [Thelazia callipaeda]|uniref:MYND-type domain-containing protein n=1 Tax=Thelazia callipaeda TaxID=103827 RepID=A0A0N5CYJ1_THECL|nr:unnamed protein product [Thelazia callipaeda]